MNVGKAIDISEQHVEKLFLHLQAVHKSAALAVGLAVPIVANGVGSDIWHKD